MGMKRRNSTFWIAWGVVAAWISFWVILVGTCLYTAVHFIRKFW